MLHALTEIGPDHLRVRTHRRRRPFGELLAEVQHDDALARPHHAFILCSTRRMVVPRSRIVLIRLITRALSSRFMPVTGSSSSKSRGRAARAMAMLSTR